MTPADRAMVPISPAGFTRPPLVGMWLTAISFTRSSSIDSSAVAEISPDAVEGTISTTTPRSRCALRKLITLLAYSASDVRMRSPGSSGTAANAAFQASVALAIRAISESRAPIRRATDR